MIVQCRRLARRHACFGQRLMVDGRIAVREQLANLGAILGRECSGAIETLDVHGVVQPGVGKRRVTLRNSFVSVSRKSGRPTDKLGLSVSPRGYGAAAAMLRISTNVCRPRFCLANSTSELFAYGEPANWIT